MCVLSRTAGIGFVTKQMKPSIITLATHVEYYFKFPSTLFLIQLPTEVSGKARDDGSNASAPAIHVADRGQVPDLLLQPEANSAY